MRLNDTGSLQAGSEMLQICMLEQEWSQIHFLNVILHDSILLRKITSTMRLRCCCAQAVDFDLLFMNCRLTGNETCRLTACCCGANSRWCVLCWNWLRMWPFLREMLSHLSWVKEDMHTLANRDDGRPWLWHKELVYKQAQDIAGMGEGEKRYLQEQAQWQLQMMQICARAARCLGLRQCQIICWLAYVRDIQGMCSAGSGCAQSMLRKMWQHSKTLAKSPGMDPGRLKVNL
jgi:hypothetical protein